MASSFSFDIVSEVDLQEADNAVNQAVKEAEHRYDLRGSNQEIEFDRGKRTITIRADGATDRVARLLHARDQPALQDIHLGHRAVAAEHVGISAVT